MSALARVQDGVEALDVESIPHAPEAEQALIGAVFYSNEMFHKVAGTVTADQFYNPIHRRIWGQIGQILAIGGVADPITLKARFRNDESLADIGGVEYLALLLSMASSGASAIEYAKLIRDMATRRELLRVSADAFAEAKDLVSEESVSDVVERASTRLFELAERGVARKTTFTFGEALTRKIDAVNRAMRDGSGLAGLSTGLPSLDNRIGGMAPHDLIILAGRPSMGKSALLATIAHNVAKAKKPCMLFSLEMSAEQVAGRFLSMQSGVPGEAIRRGDVAGQRYGHLRDAAVAMQAWPLAIDETGALALDRMWTLARRQKRLEGLELILVDYLQLMTGPFKPGGYGSKVNEVTAISTGLKAMAKDLDVPIIAAAQLSRAVEQRENKRPQLSDLRESGSIEQDADVVGFVYREEYYLERLQPSDPDSAEWKEWNEAMIEIAGKADVDFAKVRHGRVGRATLNFNGDLTLFSEATA